MIEKFTIRYLIIASILFLNSSKAVSSTDELTILSPHRLSLPKNILPVFKKQYQEKYKKSININWIDQGGASNDLKYILAQFQKNPQSSGIDIFWGGGQQPHEELASLRHLHPFPLPKYLSNQIDAKVAGVDLFPADNTWYASALTSFGIFYNRRASKLLNLPVPDTWEDLSDPIYYDNLSMADPRQSSSNITIFQIILNAHGWERGWEILSSMSANTKRFTHSSSDPVKSVVSGDTTTGLAVDYFVLPKILEIGSHNLGFSVPKGKSITNPDPISILKGAPNLEQAERFVEFILQKDTQRLLILPKGEEGGPQFSTLGLMAVNKEAYINLPAKYENLKNPYKFTAPGFRFDMKEAALTSSVLIDYFATVLIDLHAPLKKAWQHLIKIRKVDKANDLLFKPLISFEELKSLSHQWKIQSIRNRNINSWSATAKMKYEKVLSVK